MTPVGLHPTVAILRMVTSTLMLFHSFNFSFHTCFSRHFHPFTSSTTSVHADMPSREMIHNVGLLMPTRYGVPLTFFTTSVHANMPPREMIHNVGLLMPTRYGVSLTFFFLFSSGSRTARVGRSPQDTTRRGRSKEQSGTLGDKGELHGTRRRDAHSDAPLLTCLGPAYSDKKKYDCDYLQACTSSVIAQQYEDNHAAPVPYESFSIAATRTPCYIIASQQCTSKYSSLGEA